MCRRNKMDIKIYHLLEGAREADGLTVIIDVFRAFSLECYLYAMGAREIRPVGRIEEAFAWKNEDPECLLAGERGGKMCEGFDFGNSPSAAEKIDVRGKRIIHTTSAGTQGIVNAVHAEEILTGSFVNAHAVAEYIRKKNPRKVSLVCMGKAGLEPAEEDELCAVYLLACAAFLRSDALGAEGRGEVPSPAVSVVAWALLVLSAAGQALLAASMSRGLAAIIG
jgi:2-phosphosulfolactate phosphatase